MSDDESSNYSSDDDVSSDDGKGDKATGLGAFIERANAKEKKTLGDYNAFADDDDNTIAQKMRTILALRDTLGMNKDPQWLAHESQKEEELKRQANMTMEDKQAETGDMFSRLKARHGNLLEKKQAERKSAMQAHQRKAMEEKLKATEAAVQKEVDAKGEEAVNKQIDADLEVEKKVKKKKLKKKGAVSGDEDEGAPAGKKKKKKKPKAGEEGEEGADGAKKKKKKKPAAGAEGEEGKKKVKKKKPVAAGADGVVKKKKKKKPAA